MPTKRFVSQSPVCVCPNATVEKPVDTVPAAARVGRVRGKDHAE